MRMLKFFVLEGVSKRILSYTPFALISNEKIHTKRNHTITARIRRTIKSKDLLPPN